ncbi:ATP12 family chaperone protein [Enterovirga rhinocerotis]|uniref:Chaperone required for assembly of F1-ATPase n=1 Tax=Enterovirga rhinocerotis TaxID=1339210 RepID=A0A4R7C6W7_9HYPH|nr:ATP12 family protein [Enterovirga rhinocerotis]TDR94334.1 chaperone required for assembly of F1-ATPase [Enterovirga rhinocerotis]
MVETQAAPKRFYTAAEIAAGPDGFVLTLDGRPARTPGRVPLALPTRALGEAVAAEWAAQGERILPATMPLTRLANTAIDGVARELAAVRADLARYAGSDLVAYRAADPEPLVAAQSAAWDPVLEWARTDLGARFVLSQGVTYVDQPELSLARIREALERHDSPFAVAALHVMTTLTGSVLIALMHGAGRLGREEAWRAAHVDELFQESRWGLDSEAAERRALREAEFTAASTVLRLG